MSATGQQSIPEELVQRMAELTASIAALTRRIELTGVPHSTSVRRRQAGASEPHEACRTEATTKPIELVTENGFSIVRKWEADDSPAPSGAFPFLVRDAQDNERELTVEIAISATAKSAIHICDRIQHSSSFWICCAERHLANYLANHNDFPADNRMTVENLDREDLLLAIRWEKSGLGPEPGDASRQK